MEHITQPILPYLPITCQSFSKLSLMFVVKLPAILSLTIRMPTGVDFARVWTPVWILTTRMEREIDSIVQNFTEAILEALSVPLVRPNRYCLTPTPELKLKISRKNALR
jgi:hypothetical protein